MPPVSGGILVGTRVIPASPPFRRSFVHAASSTAMPIAARRAIVGLGFSQIIGWGTTYYLVSLLSQALGGSLGISTAWVLGGTSVTLAAAAVIGPRIGRWQDQAGSCIVMATGTVIMSLGLMVLALSQGFLSYYLAWIIIAIGSPMALYSAAFTALTQIAGPHAGGPFPTSPSWVDWPRRFSGLSPPG